MTTSELINKASEIGAYHFENNLSPIPWHCKEIHKMYKEFGNDDFSTMISLMAAFSKGFDKAKKQAIIKKFGFA